MSRHQKVNLKQKCSLIDKPWVPKILGELNGQYVKLAKSKGEFVWHKHDNEDELFLVVEGVLTIHLRDRDVELHPWEFFIVPRGVEHMPESVEGATAVLFEPKATTHTGDVECDLTVEELEWI